MAKDLPEYKRTTGITPLASPTGMATATQGVENSLQIYGALASQVASNAANERAQLAGITAAQNPRGTLLPAITQVDKTFRDSYREESAKVLSVQANKLLNDLTLEFSQVPNPTGSDLLKFQREARQGLESLSNLADESIRPELNRAFMQKFDADSFALANRVQRADFERILDNFNISSQTNLENIYNYFKQGMNQAALDSKLAQINNLESMREYIGEEKYRQNLEALNVSFEGAKAQAELDFIYNSEGEAAAARYVKEFNDKTHEALTASEKDAVVGQLYNRYLQNEKIEKMGDSIELSNAKVEMANSVDGLLSPDRLSYYQEHLSAESFNRLQLAQIEAQGAGLSSRALAAQMVNDFGSRSAMLQYTGKQKDAVFAQLIEFDKEQAARAGQEYSQPLLRQARLAQNIQSPIPSFIAQLESAIRYGDANSIAEAGMAIKALQANNPIALDGLDKDVRSIASLFNNYRLNTQATPEEAADKAKNAVYGVDEDTKIARLNTYKDIIRDRGLNNQDEFTKFVANNIGAKRFFRSDREYPAGLVTKVQELLPSYYQRVGNWDVAVDELFEDLNQVYKVTNTNNREEIMVLPPESILPQVGFWDKNDKALALKEIVDENAAIIKAGGFVQQKLEWDNPPDFSNLLTVDLVPGDLKIKVDGVERKVIVISDDVTQLSGSENPSWAFMYLDDNGIAQPISDVTQFGGLARWYPDFINLEKQKMLYPQAQYDKAIEAHKKMKRDIKDGVDNIKPYPWID